MNKRLELLQPYPFERLNAMLDNVQPPAGVKHIPLSLGEPKHATPDFLVELYRDEKTVRHGLGTYPPTRGIPELRQAIADFVNARFNLASTPVDPESMVLPVNGTREALFAVAQALIDPVAQTTTLMPNPFYQIYEGAALLAGSTPVFLPCKVGNDFNPDFSGVTEDEWARCAMVYICSPGNPTGAVMSIEDMQDLIRRSDEFGFVIVSDECYSEIYDDESAPPPGLLEAASAMGRADFANCLAFNSLSKRSNLPGLRSGYVCGDSRLIEQFLLYRTYHGSAMPVHHQHISTAAWRDEDHVWVNRSLYRAKFDAVLEVLENVWPISRPPAGFYLWPQTPIDDLSFTSQLMAHQNIKVVPGTFLGREGKTINPGTGRVRMALVASPEECLEAALRLREFITEKQYMK